MSVNAIDSPIYAAVGGQASGKTKDIPRKWKRIIIVSLIVNLIAIGLSLGLFFVSRQQAGQLEPPKHQELNQLEEPTESFEKPLTTSGKTMSTSTTTKPSTATIKTITEEEDNFCINGLQHADRCFTIPFHDSNLLFSFQGALDFCGNPAEVIDEVTHNILEEHVRSQWFALNPTQDSVDVWLGSTYPAEDNFVSLYSLVGATGPFGGEAIRENLLTPSQSNLSHSLARRSKMKEIIYSIPPPQKWWRGLYPVRAGPKWQVIPCFDGYCSAGRTVPLVNMHENTSKNSPRRRITLRNNSTVRVTRWAPGFPANNSSFTNVGMRVNKERRNRNQGLFNVNPVNGRAILLCESAN